MNASVSSFHPDFDYFGTVDQAIAYTGETKLIVRYLGC